MEISEIVDTDISVVVSFHNSFHEDKKTVKQWLWEYRGMKPDSFVFSLTRDGGHLVGTQGMIPIPIIIEGKRLLSGKSESSLLDPNYRGTTFFRDLYEFAVSRCKEKGMRCIWGFTSAARVWREKLHFYVNEDCMCECTLLLALRPILSELLGSRDTIVRRFASSLETVYLYLSSRIFGTRSTKKAAKNIFSIMKHPKSANDVGALYKNLRQRNPHLIHIDQDEKYFGWRISDNPNVAYETYFVYEGRLLRAYCYVAVGHKEARITDLTFETYEAGDFLTRFIISILRSRKVFHASFLGNARNPLILKVLSLLRSYGFIRRRIFRMPFVLRSLSRKHGESLRDIRNWYLNGLWTEGYSY